MGSETGSTSTQDANAKYEGVAQPKLIGSIASDDSGYATAGETRERPESLEDPLNISETPQPKIEHEKEDTGGDATTEDVSKDAEYVARLEERLEEAEKKVKQLSGDDFDLGIDDGYPFGPEIIQEAKVHRMTYKEFREVKKTVGFVKTGAAVLVCYDDADMICTSKEPEDKQDGKITQQTPWQNSSPTRVAINSQILADVLTAETPLRISSRNVLMRPFKAILVHEVAIREAFKRVTEACETEKAKVEAAGVSTSLAEISDDANVTDSMEPSSATPDSIKDEDDTNSNLQKSYEQKCIERDHLRCLIEFLDMDMQSIFELRRQIEDRNLSGGGIAYQDLSHLYKPGDIVVPNWMFDSKPKRAYCVLHVTGGRPLIEKRSTTTTTTTALDPPTTHNGLTSTFGFSTGVSPFVLDCFYLDYNGAKFGPREERLIMQEYSGMKPVLSLEVVPINFLQDLKVTQSSLLARGKRYADLCPISHKIYKGLTLGEKIEKSLLEAAIELTPREEVNSEVIIDQKAGIENFDKKEHRFDFNFGGGILEKSTQMEARELDDETVYCSVPGCNACTDIYPDGNIDTDARMAFIRKTKLLRYSTLGEELTDEHYIIMTPRVYGYALQERKWHALNVEHVADHQTDTNKLQNGQTAFDDLVLPKSHKALLQALVRNQTRQFHSTSAIRNVDDEKPEKQRGDISMDLVRGKGKGVIILLHGAPGVGKTSTAECVASQLGRPLFPITCGDLGVDASTVEIRLEEYFRLASQWGCVLLLDEADVFLARRSNDQLKRNALVSVFLRVLEYYAGVLMLTTNRVGAFDEAFRSRIHISLYYPKLDKKTTSEIWEMNLRRILQANDVDIDIDEAGITKFYKKHWKDNKKSISRRWNGRQIKNAFQTALALANWEFHDGGQDSKRKPKRPHLEARHFDQVAETSNHFDDYLMSVHREGLDEGDDVFGGIAKREGLRDDKDLGIKPSRHQSRRHHDEDTSSSSSDSEGEYEKRKRAKRDAKKNKTKAKKKHTSDPETEEINSNGEKESASNDSGSDRDQKKRKSPKKDSKKNKTKSKRGRHSDLGDDNSSSDS